MHPPSNIEALPCPFCGKAADLEYGDTLYPTGIWWREEDGIRHYVRHKDRKEGDRMVWGMHCPEVAWGCGAEIHADTKEEALAKWNRRASNDQLNANGVIRVAVEAPVMQHTEE